MKNITLRYFSIVDSIIVILLFTAASYSFYFFKTSEVNTVAIYKDNSLYALFPLNEDRTITIQGFQGTVTVCIARNSVSVPLSSCRNQICRKSGPIHSSYQQIVCAPNHILIEILPGGNSHGPDAVAR